MKHTFKTRLNRDDVNATQTVADVDFDGVSMEDLQKLALRSVVIEQQAIYRTSGVIPVTDTIKVAELLKKTRQPFVPTPENMAARAMKMTPGQRAALLEKLLEQQG